MTSQRNIISQMKPQAVAVQPHNSFGFQLSLCAY